MNEKPYLITLPKVSNKSAHLSFLQEGVDLPIQIKRAYWIYDVEEDVVRGNHAHANSDRIIVCIKGTVEISLEDVSGNSFAFVLDDQHTVLYFPRLHWIHMRLTPACVVMVFSSCLFEDDVMVTDYEAFKRIRFEKQYRDSN